MNLVKLGEAACQLGLSKSTFYKGIRKGKFDGIAYKNELNGRYYIDMDKYVNVIKPVYNAKKGKK